MDRLVAGIIRSSHGLRGYVKVYSLSGERDHFFRMKEVVLKQNSLEKVYRIEDVKSLGEGLIVKFEGIESPEEGKRLSGAELWVDRDFAAPLKNGEFYTADIIGCVLIFGGEKAGTVKSLLENGLTDLLEVECDDGIHLVPLTDQFIGGIHIGARTIELKDDWVLK